jgi:hypothetical protein
VPRRKKLGEMTTAMESQNPKVDSGLALSYLHLLPTKVAFQAYKAYLPSVVTKARLSCTGPVQHWHCCW